MTREKVRNEPPPGDRPGGPKPWSEQARRSWKAWRNYYPSLAYARGDRRTFYIPIDEAANMAGLSRRNFYKRYLMSARLPYVVKTWFHGRKMRRKSLVPRGAVVELSRASFARPCTLALAVSASTR